MISSMPQKKHVLGESPLLRDPDHDYYGLSNDAGIEESHPDMFNPNSDNEGLLDGEEIEIGTITNHRRDFVEWADGANVEAVFCGHTHENHIFYDVHTDPAQEGYMDDPYRKPNPVDLNILSFSSAPFYIESGNST